MNRFFAAGLLCVISLFTSSCKLQNLNFLSKKKHKHTDSVQAAAISHNFILLPAPDTVEVATTIDASTAMEQLKVVLVPILNKKISYKTFVCKSKVHYETSDDSKDFTAHIRMVKDSAIWVNVTALGLSVVKMYVTPDSLFMVNYINKNATKLSFKYVSEVLPVEVDFASLQHIITGDPVRGGDVKSLEDLNSMWKLNVDDGEFGQTLLYKKTDSLLKECFIKMLQPNSPEATLKYANYVEKNTNKIATTRNVDILNKGQHIYLDLDIEDISLDGQVEMPFSIPKSYKVTVK